MQANYTILSKNTLSQSAKCCHVKTSKACFLAHINTGKKLLSIVPHVSKQGVFFGCSHTQKNSC